MKSQWFVNQRTNERIGLAYDSPGEGDPLLMQAVVTFPSSGAVIVSSADLTLMHAVKVAIAAKSGDFAEEVGRLIGELYPERAAPAFLAAFRNLKAE